MILYKTIALKFGHHLNHEEPATMQGPDGRPVSPEEVQQHWKSVLDDLSNARIYLLDHNAANYLDSLRMDVQGMPWEDSPEFHIQGHVRDIELPRELIWVEYDDRKLWEGRVARGITTLSEEELELRHQRGFLFDNRACDKLTVRLFSAMTDKVFFDAPLVLEISKGHDGRPDFGNVSWHLQSTVVAGLMRLANWMRDASVQENIDTHKGHLSYEMVIGFMLFAALSKREDDLQSNEAASLSAAQAKTARRFGKTWMTDTLKSHVTIRIGPAAERHLAEQAARLQYERERTANRASPTEHWVAEHERQYADGKVVLVRAHKRGRSVDDGLPTRIVGPKSLDQ